MAKLFKRDGGTVYYARIKAPDGSWRVVSTRCTDRRAAEAAVGAPPPHIVEATLDEAGNVTVTFRRRDTPDDHDRARWARRREGREAQEADEAAFNDRCDRAAWAVGLTRDAWIRQVLEAKLAESTK